MDDMERAVRLLAQGCSPHECEDAANLLGVEHPDCADSDGYECEGCAERIADAIAEHLMPHPLQWPRFEDGERAAFRDEVEVDGSVERIQGFKFYESGPSFVSIVGADREKWVRVEEGGRVKRPERPAPHAPGGVLCEDCKHAVASRRGLVCTVHGDAGWFATASCGYCHRGERR